MPGIKINDDVSLAAAHELLLQQVQARIYLPKEGTLC